MDKVSIIIPIYNAQNSLEKCILSVLKQSYKNMEVILINDGSSDNTHFLCQKLSNTDNRIKYIRQINSGPSNARNTGLKISTGKFLQFVDADDYLDFPMTETLVQKIKDDSSDFVISGYYSIFTDKMTKTENVLDTSKKILSQKEVAKEFFKFIKFPHINVLWNKLYKTKIIKEKLIFFDETLSLGEDLLFNIEYLQQCPKISILPHGFYNYVSTNQFSLSKKYYSNFFEIQTLLFDTIKNFLKFHNEYNGENIKFLEGYYADMILSFIAKLYKNNLSQEQINQKLNQIITNKQVIDALPYYKNTSLNKRILLLLVKYQQINLLNFLYRLKYMGEK